MAPRNIFYASPLPEIRNVHLLNPSNANPRRHIESTMLGLNEHTIMNYCVNFPRPNTLNSGAIYENYRHPVFSVGSNQNMTYQTQNGPYCYNQLANQTGATMSYPPAENSRMAKRKTAAHPVYENHYGYQFTGSSSNFPVPPNHFQLKPMQVYSRPQLPDGSVYRYHDEALLSVGEEYQRNVRIRHNSAPQEDLNPAWQSSSSRPTQLFHSSASISGGIVVGGQWHQASPPGTYSHYAGSSNYLMSQSVLRNSDFGGNTEQNSAWYSDNGRNSNAMVPNPQGSDAQGTWAGPTSYDQRLALNRISSNNSNQVATQGTCPSGTIPVSSSRIPRLTNSQNVSSNRVSRNFNTGWLGNANHGWTSQGSSVVDVPSSAYTFDLFDEHRGLRLDIDNMSYEEILVLEERIGNVNTGLSEDLLARCLTERAYCSSASAQDDHVEASCPICLEEFKDKDSQGVMKCQHIYHVTCIKKWLGLKKTCPVCKAPAVDDDVKQKQKVSL